VTKSERVALRRDIQRRRTARRQHHLGMTPHHRERITTMSNTTALQVGDRVRMDPEYTYLGVPGPDLGIGTVVSTDDEYLMTGMYVRVQWDENHGTLVETPAIAALIKVEEA
jgi:hypothetical protein